VFLGYLVERAIKPPSHIVHGLGHCLHGYIMKPISDILGHGNGRKDTVGLKVGVKVNDVGK
jgi:hypothetical protein